MLLEEKYNKTLDQYILNDAINFAFHKKLSGGKWKVPVVVRAACGGGYRDAGQHEQSLWGWLAHIPGLTVVVPSTPTDAGGMMLEAIEHEDPVIYLEHKLLSSYWLDSLGTGGRTTVHFDVPAEGVRGPIPDSWTPVPLGKAATRREGKDITLVSVGVGVHRSMEAAAALEEKGISAGVLDLRTVSPLDREALCKAVSRTGRLLVVDEDYRDFGLSGELAATGGWDSSTVQPSLHGRYIPYSRELEDQVLPNKRRIVDAALRLMES